MIRYEACVPLEQTQLFTQRGWIFKEFSADRPDRAVLWTTDKSPGPDRTINIDRALQAPTTIQQFKIKRPLFRYEKQPFGAAVEPKYMGIHNDTEQNTVMASMERIRIAAFAFDVMRAHNFYVKIDSKVFALRMFTRKIGTELDDYVDVLRHVRSGESPTLRPSGFTLLDFREDQLPPDADMWWDVCNDVIFAYDKNAMKRIPYMLEASFATMKHGGRQRQLI